MGRPRTFDSDQALERAMEVFWAKGYEASSLCELVEAMGVSKSSLYETFTSKHELFLAALERYRASVVARLVEQLERDGPAREVVGDVFREVVECAVTRGDARGCFLGNTAVETAAHDAAAAAQVRAGMARIEAAFHRLVLRGQAAGEIGAQRDARALARFLTSTMNGLRVMAKTGHDRATLEDIVRVALSALD